MIRIKKKDQLNLMRLMKIIKMYANNSYIQYNALLLKYSCASIHNILYYKEKKNY